LRRSKEVGISLVALALRRASAFAFAALGGSAFAFPVCLPAVRSSPTVALPAIVSLSTLVHGVLLAMPRPTTLERRFRGVPDKSFEAPPHRC